MTSQKKTIGLVAVALFVGSMTAHAPELGAGYKAYQRRDYTTPPRIFRQLALFVRSMTAHAADFGAGYEAYQRGDYAMALRIFRQFADQGDATAQFNLGLMYGNGRGVP